MNWKGFLKPDWKKIIIFIILLIIFLPFKYVVSAALPIIWAGRGLPLPIYIDILVGEGMVWTTINYPLLGVLLIIDLIFWYFLSCFIVWIYDKVKKK